MKKLIELERRLLKLNLEGRSRWLLIVRNLNKPIFERSWNKLKASSVISGSENKQT